MKRERDQLPATPSRELADYIERSARDGSPLHLTSLDKLAIADSLRIANTPQETSRSESAPITAEDKRWRFLEHGCQFVSWTPTGGETVSFDPRDVKHLSSMREKADRTLHEQVAQLRAEADALERRMKK